MPNITFKPVTSTISSRQEQSIFTSITSTNLIYTLCDRTIGSSKYANYFTSFNLPYTYEALPSGSTLAVTYPEIYQLNVDKVIIAPIPKSYYSELIDGRSITLDTPQISGTTSVSAKTIVSSTYTTLTKTDSNPILGGNIAFLFCDEINAPYVGTTNNGQFSNSGNSTWNTTNYTQRPASISYADLSSSDINTDTRLWSDVNLAVSVPENYPTNTNQGYNYDIPVGFVALDKGFIVYTHPMVVDNFPWGLGYEYLTNGLNTLSGTTDIYFTGQTSTALGTAGKDLGATYIDISINFKTTVVCLALPQEFYFSNNPSWDFEYNYNELLNETNGFQSVYVTEIGLYNRINELVAVAKLSEPFEKTYTNVMNFTLNIDV